MNWLKKVAELHEDYLRMVKSFGEEFLAEDIVQEMYIKLSKYADADKVLRKNGQINKSYIFLTLRCLYYDLQKERNKILFVWIIIDIQSNLLGKGTYLYERECPSVHPSVRPSLGLC